MRVSNKLGFTIIETMLFLAVSGALLAAILIGTGSSINVQRYRDSVSSLQAFLQAQYADVSNVSNDRAISDLPCGSVIAISIGQSDCVILGKYISTTDSKNLLVQSVVGNIPTGSTATLDDINVFLKAGDGTNKGFNAQISPMATNSYNLEWGTAISDIAANKSKPLQFSMLILRSPISGILRTFVSPTTISAANIQRDLISKSALTQKVEMCVNPNGLVNGAVMAVIVDANTTSASGIETLGDNNSGC